MSLLTLSNFNDVVEQQGAVCNYGDVQLANGSSLNDGIVELCVDDAWGTICGENWDKEDANVVCAQLGFLPTGEEKLVYLCMTHLWHDGFFNWLYHFRIEKVLRHIMDTSVELAQTTSF